MRRLHGFLGLLVTGGVVASLESAGPTDSPYNLFDFEKVQLTEEITQKAPSDFRSYLEAHDGISPVPVAEQKCKTYPGDANWPGDDVWKGLSMALNGALLKPSPVASVCYNQTGYHNYDGTKCSEISANWSNTFVRLVLRQRRV